MLRFLSSFALVWIILLMVAQATSPYVMAASSRWSMVVTLLGLPVLGALTGGAVVTRLRCPRALHPCVDATPHLVLSGLAAGLASAALTGGVVLVTSDGVGQLLAVAGGSAVAAGGAAWLLPRVRPGACVHCGYELVDLARCPECGRLSVDVERSSI
ncbi:MAG: hypothetical protein HBSAPP03_19410 [Phycisphaerae bacterium]|nr:MAG: hypothetical protein HBSAPP03_19410 [Phycisphaerae bacterium]